MYVLPKIKKNRDKFYIKDMFIRTIIGFVKKKLIVVKAE